MQLIEQNNGFLSEVRQYGTSLLGSLLIFDGTFVFSKLFFTFILPRLIPIFSSIKPSQVLFVVIKVRKSTLLSKTTIPKISSVPNFILFSFSFSPTKSQNFLAKSPFIYLYFIFPKHVSNFTTAFAKSLMQE